MDSINRNQPEENHRDLSGTVAVQQIRTIVGLGESDGKRPMNVRQVDDQGDLWFLSADDSYKNAELARDPAVTLYFQGSPHSDFLVLNGTATISRDRAKIKELWTATIGTWFTDGVDDPRITVIKVTPTSGYYWDTKHGNAVAGMKIVVGSMIGKTLDDSIEGSVRV